MVYINTPKNYDVSDLHLICDDCGSDQIIETPQGYVCTMCGIELEVPKMEYHRPYEENKLQHAPLGRTQIGNQYERIQNTHSNRVNSLNRLQNIKDNEEVMSNIAKNLISKILSDLNLPRNLFQIYLKKYKNIRKKLSKGTKYRSPEKLVPIVIYYCTKFRNIPINASDLLEITDIEKKDFDSFRLQLIHFWPEYLERNRKEYILKRVMEVAEKYELGMDFYGLAHRLLEKLWEGIKCTKDDVVAGLVSSIVILCNYKDAVPVNRVCKTLNIRMSTIQSQVRRKIFERFQIPGFKTLVKSSEILHKMLDKLGLLKFEGDNSEVFKQDISNTAIQNKDDIIEIQLNNSLSILNNIDNIEYHCFAIKDNQDNNPLILEFQIDKTINKLIKKDIEINDIQFDLVKYPLNSKGPPIISA
ncbi:MAG: hypothetical protein GF317_13350 [Candidatus Lokiarchaeota archaeon]|nr:hypothetical protein [Candidatus Lokiarchaeota archaeon]MBD3200623.1 hypothetical protein [Candidatus Lokiarchaeota archaeon]